MVFNAIFNNILVKSWTSVLLVEETGVPGENHRAASHYQILSHNIVTSTPRHERRDSKHVTEAGVFGGQLIIYVRDFMAY
jgi:hypothetical protein